MRSLVLYMLIAWPRRQTGRRDLSYNRCRKRSINVVNLQDRILQEETNGGTHMGSAEGFIPIVTADTG